jgi:itaconyl-CoA hydratase
MGLTLDNNFFEDFKVGMVLRHARGKTIEAAEHVLITNLTMNTAQGHFNEHQAKTTRFGQRIVFGGYTASLVIGLASQDTSENAIAELGLDKIRLPFPVVSGDTLYAYTEVLSVEDGDNADGGVVRFKHWGVNQDDKIVFEGERTALIRRRSRAISL